MISCQRCPDLTVFGVTPVYVDMSCAAYLPDIEIGGFLRLSASTLQLFQCAGRTQLWSKHYLHSQWIKV